MESTGDNSEKKKYESFKIPIRQQAKRAGMAQYRRNKLKEQAAPTLSDGVFYEIDYDACPVPGVGKFVAKPQKIEKPEPDEVRELFSRMREIAHSHRERCGERSFRDIRLQHDNAIVFYEQAMFMQNYEDDYAGSVPFSQYFPCYQMMGYEQLRTYFTWRTQVRKGSIANTSLSYAFLYIYELLNNIGVSDPQDGLNKLMLFWNTFRDYNTSVDRYVLRWLKDYHIYYELQHSFKDFIAKNDLAEHYPKAITRDDDFDLFCSVSKYDIKKSTFLAEELPPDKQKFFADKTRMITDCFAFTIARIRQEFEAAGINFDNSLFRPAKKISQWKPFKDALFCHRLKQPDRRVLISESEIYFCKSNEWSFSTSITTEKGERFIGYVMKQMESVLRSITKYRFKVTAKLSMINEDTLRVLTKAGLHIDKIVTAAVMDFHKDATKTVVTVDSSALERIRREALITQEALSVEEKEPAHIPAAPEPDSQPNQDIFADPVDTKAVPPPANSPNSEWNDLKDALEENELRALALILNGGDIKSFADACGIMLEVLIDGINGKSLDIIGDSLMDEELNLFDDYKERTKELLG